MMFKNYKTLIQSLPVDEMCFTSKREVWTLKEKCQWLEDANSYLFGDNETITLTKYELKMPPKDMRHFILKVIYWGYPRGMRGDHFKKMIKEENIQKLEDILKICFKINDNFEFFFKKLKGINRIGISTFTKFLYFLNAEVEGYKALILDNPIMQALSKSPFKQLRFENLRIDNAPSHYVKYLQRVTELAKELETQPENIEMFLFLFYNRLKVN